MNLQSWLVLLIVAQNAGPDRDRKAEGTPIPRSECGALLQRISGQLEANFDRIRLWKGVYRVASVTETEGATKNRQRDATGMLLPEQHVEGRFHFHSEDVAEFFLDIPQDSLLSRFARTGQPFFKAVDSSLVIAADSTKGRRQWCILAKGQYLEFNPDRRGYVDLNDLSLTTAAGNSRVVVHDDPAKGARRINRSDIVDPRKLYEFGNVPFPDVMRTIERMIQSQHADRVRMLRTVGQHGPQIQILQQMGANGEERCQFVLEEALGYHPSRVSLEVPRALTFRNEWTYTNLEGIFVPETWLDEQIRPDGSLVSRRTLTLDSSEFPEQLVGVTFTAADFKVQDGDLLVDKIEQKNYRFRAGTPVPPAEFIMSQRGESVRWLMLVAILGTCCAITIVLARLLRRRHA